MIYSLKNIYHLGIKELRSLFNDTVMIIMIIYSFSFGIYVGATSQSYEIKNASIAFVDMDKSILSNHIISAFYKPKFNTPDIINFEDIDKNMDSGFYTFVVIIPQNFEQNIISNQSVDIQVNVDATRMTQAGIGSGYIQQIIYEEINGFLNKDTSSNINLVQRYKYNQTLDSTWFGAINEVINNIVMLSILLSGAAIIREKEHGTIEHLLVMPIKPFEIMSAKIWSVCLVILLCVSFSIYIMLEKTLQIPINGSVPLFLFGTLLILFATTSMGIFIGTVARNMPQLGMIFILTILPLMMLSGNITPFESMPIAIQDIMLFMPTSHFVEVSQAILFKGASLDIVYKNMLWIFFIGVGYFVLTLLIFRKSLQS